MFPRPLSVLASVALLVVGTSTIRLGAATSEDPRLATLESLAKDASPKVRLEALRALAKIPNARAAAAALAVLDQPMDPTLDYALWLTINDLAEPWIAALQAGEWKPEGREKQLEFALKSIRPEQASRVLGQLLASSPLNRDGRGPWIELIGSAGTPRELRLLLDQVLQGQFDEPAAGRALKALGEAQRLRRTRPTGAVADVGQLFDSSSEALRIGALQLAAQWKDLGPHFPKLGQIAAGANTSPAVRTAAVDALRAMGGPGALEALAKLAKTAPEPRVRRQASAALANLDLNAALEPILTQLKTLTDETEALEYWRALLPVKGAAKALASAIAEGPADAVPAPAARAGMRVAREGGRSDLDLVTALAKASGQAADTQAFTGQLIKELAERASARGEPHRGESIYRRQDLACMSCHAIGGAGGKVGPDLTSIGASAPIDYLVESLLLPNAKIKEGYHTVLLSNKDGDEFSGTLARENNEEIVLRNAAGAELSFPKSSLASRVNGTMSLMPAGLLEPLNEQEQLDLVAFLSRLGKPGDFDASKGGVARRWFLNVFTHTEKQHARDNDAWQKPLIDKMWNPVYSHVDGNLTKALLEETGRQQFWVGVIAIQVATELQTAKPGPVHFKLTAAGAELHVDGRKVGGAGESVVDLPAGTHRVIVRLDPKQVPSALRLESSDANFVLSN